MGYGILLPTRSSVTSQGTTAELPLILNEILKTHSLVHGIILLLMHHSGLPEIQMGVSITSPLPC